MLYKTKKQNIANIFSEDNELTKISNEAEKIINEKNKEKSIETVAEEQKAKKLNSHDDGLKTSHSIASAATGQIGYDGGHSIKKEIPKSIWGDNTKKESAIDIEKSIDNINNEINKNDIIKHQDKKYKNNNNVFIADAKKAIVFSEKNFKKHTFKSSRENVSLFDNSPFERLPEKTEGEKIVDENKKKKMQKDESWKNSGKVLSSKDILNKLYDNLTGNTE